MAFVATFIGSAAFTGMGAVAGSVGLTGLGTALAGTAGVGGLAGSGLAAGMLGGAIVGAGVGQLTGGNTKSTLTGMGIGAGVGGLAGGLFGVGGAGGWLTGTAKTASAIPAEFANHPGAAQYFTSGPGAANFASNVAAGAPNIGGPIATKASLAGVLMNPLLIGATGIGLASAFSDKGQSFQDRIRLKPEGKELMYGKISKGGYVNAVKQQYVEALSGKPSERAFQDVSNVKTIEAVKKKTTDAAFLDAQAKMANVNPINRGYAAPSGKMAEAAGEAATESMAGKFAPASILNNYSREDLMNAFGGIQNVQNLESQTAMINYQGNLAKYNAANYAAAQQGLGIGGTVSMVGRFMQDQAYINRLNAMKIA